MINWWALHYDPEWYNEPEKVTLLLSRTDFIGLFLIYSLNQRDS